MTPKRIHLIGDDSRHEEALAAATITPGMLIALNSDGEVIPHGTQGGYAERLYALEDALQGRTIDDDYVDGERVSLAVAVPGDVVYAWLADGDNVAIGALLTSEGTGKLETVGGGDVPCAVALEALDLSDSETDEGLGRIKVRVL